MDQKTIFIILIIMFVISDFALCLLWLENRKRASGLILLPVAFLLQTAGLALIFWQEMILDVVSVIVAGNLIFLGLILLIIGMEKFLNVKWHKTPNFILLGMSVALYAYFTFIQPNRYIRDCIVFNAMIVILYTQLAWLFLRHAFKEIRGIARVTAAICVLLIAGGILRLVMQSPLHIAPAIRKDALDLAVIMTYLILNVLLTISVVLLVSGRMRRDIQYEANKFNKFLNNVPFAIVVCRLADQVIIDVNSRMEKLAGYQKDEMLEKTFNDLNMMVNLKDHNLRLEQLKLGREMIAGEFALRRKDTSVVTVMCSARVMNINGGSCIINCFNDVSEVTHIRKQPLNVATYDPLTGVTNRMLLYDRYEMAMAHAQRSQKKIAIAMIGMDSFQDINETYSETVGDKLLIQASRRMARFCRTEDTVVRYRGDEFIILMTHVKNEEAGESAFRRLLHAFKVPFVINGETIKITLSIGIALYPDHGSDINDLIRKADIAMYYVKKNGKNNLRFFEEHPEGNVAS